MAQEPSISIEFFRKPRWPPRVYGLKGPQQGRSVGNCLANNEDQILLMRLQRGERAAFEELADRHGPRMIRIAHRLLGWSGNGHAHDVVQDVLARMISKPQRIAAAGGNLEAWLIRVTVNECRTQKRRWLARLNGLRERYVVREPSPQVDSEIQEQVRRAVRILPPRDREVIVLHYLEELPVAEIAAMLGRTCNAVEVRLHRARARLKEKLERFVKD
jgi:RNA polymerase sigma-70 factor (ECF subfamily)